MNKNIFLLALLAILIGMTGCVSDGEDDYVPPIVQKEKVNLEASVLDEAVTGSTCNSLADTIGPVTITVDKDTSFDANYPLEGGAIRVVEYLGKKALEVTQNANNEIRVGFLLNTPASLAGYTTLSYRVAGLEGFGGVYNCGLLYTDARDSGERIGSFYVSPVFVDVWTDVELNLVDDENWGNNFSEDRVLASIQFWTNQSKKIYITDLSLK